MRAACCLRWGGSSGWIFLSSKPINYDIKREKSASLLRSIAINETSSIVESIDALLTNINNNENIEILEKTKRDLLEAQNKIQDNLGLSVFIQNKKNNSGKITIEV